MNSSPALSGGKSKDAVMFPIPASPVKKVGKLLPSTVVNHTISDSKCDSGTESKSVASVLNFTKPAQTIEQSSVPEASGEVEGEGEKNDKSKEIAACNNVKEGVNITECTSDTENFSERVPESAVAKDLKTDLNTNPANTTVTVDDERTVPDVTVSSPTSRTPTNESNVDADVAVSSHAEATKLVSSDAAGVVDSVVSSRLPPANGDQSRTLSLVDSLSRGSTFSAYSESSADEPLIGVGNERLFQERFAGASNVPPEFLGFAWKQSHVSTTSAESGKKTLSSKLEPTSCSSKGPHVSKTVANFSHDARIASGDGECANDNEQPGVVEKKSAEVVSLGAEKDESGLEVAVSLKIGKLEVIHTPQEKVSVPDAITSQTHWSSVSEVAIEKAPVDHPKRKAPIESLTEKVLDLPPSAAKTSNVSLSEKSSAFLTNLNLPVAEISTESVSSEPSHVKSSSVTSLGKNASVVSSPEKASSLSAIVVTSSASESQPKEGVKTPVPSFEPSADVKTPGDPSVVKAPSPVSSTTTSSVVASADSKSRDTKLCGALNSPRKADTPTRVRHHLSSKSPKKQVAERTAVKFLELYQKSNQAQFDAKPSMSVVNSLEDCLRRAREAKDHAKIKRFTALITFANKHERYRNSPAKVKAPKPKATPPLGNPRNGVNSSTVLTLDDTNSVGDMSDQASVVSAQSHLSASDELLSMVNKPSVKRKLDLGDVETSQGTFLQGVFMLFYGSCCFFPLHSPIIIP